MLLHRHVLLHLLLHQVARIPVSSLCGVVGVEGEVAPLSTDLPHLYIHLDRDSTNSLSGGEAHYVQLDLKVCAGAGAGGPPRSWEPPLAGTSE